MASINTGSIPKVSLLRVTPGIDQPEDSIADLICARRTDVEAISGEAPFLTDEATVSRGLNMDLAPGEDPKSDRGGMGNINFSCKRQVGRYDIYDESSIQAAAFDLDLVDHFMRMARKDANTATDRKFAGVISDTTKNLAYNVATDGNGAWDDLTNATPLQDMVDMSDLVPHSDTVVVGRKVLSALRKHPEAMGEVINYEGGGVMTPDHIRAAIAAIFDISLERVFLLTKQIFNTAALGQSYQRGFIAEDVFWVGAGYDLQLFDPNNEKNRNPEMQRTPSVGETIYYTRFVDIVRHLKNNAVTATNILT